MNNTSENSALNDKRRSVADERIIVSSRAQPSRKSLLERSLHWNPGLVWLVLGLFGAACTTAAVYVLWLVFELIRNPLA